jgi:hypothetical protein
MGDPLYYDDMSSEQVPLGTFTSFADLGIPNYINQTPWYQLGGPFSVGGRNFDQLSSAMGYGDSLFNNNRGAQELYGQNANLGWGDLARGAGYGLGGLTLGLGALSAWQNRFAAKDDRNLRNRQLALSERAQNFSMDQAQKSAGQSDARNTAATDDFNRRAVWVVARDPRTGRQGYRNKVTGEFSENPDMSVTYKAKAGGLAMASGGRGARRPSRSVRGAGTGQSDEIPALLSDGEYVIDASTVSDLGDGSTEAGSKKLDAMVKSIRKEKRGGLSQLPAKAKQPMSYLKKGK